MPSKEHEGLSRRDFIRGTALGSAALVGAGALAGCAPERQGVPAPTNPGDSSDKTTDPGVYPFETVPTPVPDSAISEIVDTEVLVIGFGSSGIPAALSAAETGARVAVMQKAAGLFAQGFWIGGFGSKLQTAEGYSPDLLPILVELQNASAGKADFDLLKLWGYNSGKVLDWLMEYSSAAGIRVEWAKDVQTAESSQHQYPALHVWDGWLGGLMQSLVDACAKKGVDIHYEMPALQLIRENDRIVGAVGKDAAGRYVRFNAEKGVILATGDYGSDADMVEKYCPAALGVENYYAPKLNTGDGQKMALWVGAKMMRWQHAPMFGYSSSEMPRNDFPFAGSPWLSVNKLGKRFCNEDVPLEAQCHADLRQSGHTRFQICDANWNAQWPQFGRSWTRLPIVQGLLMSTTQGSAEEVWAAGLKTGTVVQAKTIEELADTIGVPQKALVATVNRYNELVAKGVDEDFGKNPAYLAVTGITQAPFFAIKRRPGLMGVVGGGVLVDTQLRVLTESGQPIPGLYAAGNVAGGFYGNDYTQLVPGGSLGRATTFGYLAGRFAAGKADS